MEVGIKYKERSNSMTANKEKILISKESDKKNN